MEQLNKKFWQLTQNRSTSASTHLLNLSAPPPDLPCPCERYLRRFLAWRKKTLLALCPESFCTWKVVIQKVLVFVPMLRRYFRPDICHEYHELYLWKKIVMLKNFSFPFMTIVGKLKKRYRRSGAQIVIVSLCSSNTVRSLQQLGSVKMVLS